VTGARRLWLVAALVGLAAAGWWLWDVYRAPNRADLTAYWQLVIAVAALVVAVVAVMKGAQAQPASGDADESEFARLADRLAAAVHLEWDQAAAARGLLHPDPIGVRWVKSAMPVAGTAAAAAGSTRFRPIPGLAATRPEQLGQGGLADLHAVYGGLGSGRVVIVGGPGAGKSGAAVLLVLAALDHRRAIAEADRARVPVPVLFTLHGWDPRTRPLLDWLVSQLRQTYDGLFTGRRGAAKIAELIRAGKISVILDGLDEIAEELRPVALRALSEQAMFRLVVLSRGADMVDAAKRAMLDGAVAVELQDVDPAAAADYLQRVQLDPPPDRWRELTDVLRNAPQSPIALALSNPLTLTLIRDTYRTGDSVGELLDLGADVSREDVEDHLLDRVLPQAYATRPGQPPARYTLATAQRTLQWIAGRMSQDRTRDLAWWRIPTWTPVFPRALAIGLISGLVFLGGVGVAFGGGGPWFGTGGNVVGSLVGLSAMLGAWFGSRKPPPTAPTRWRFVFDRPIRVFLIGALYGNLFMQFLSNRLGAGIETGLLILFVTGLVLWLLVGLAIWLVRKTHQETAVMRWRAVHSHRFVVFTVGFGSAFLGTVAAFVLLGSLGLRLMWALLPLVVFGLSLRFALGALGRGSVSPLTPIASWIKDRAAGFMIWFGLALFAGPLIPGLTAHGWMLLGISPEGAPFQITIGLWVLAGLVLGLIYPETWSSFLASTQLAIRRGTPIRLMRFLDDARERNVLRTVGPVYQFRHARLQDRLAVLDTSASALSRHPDSPAHPVPGTSATLQDSGADQSPR